MKIPKAATNMTREVVQDIAWKEWRGGDQPFTLDKGRGRIFFALLAWASGRTLFWFMPQMLI